MKTGAAVSIPVTMIFKKYYCHKCGERLKRQKVKQVVNPGDSGYENARDRFDEIPMKGSISVTSFVFACPTCRTTITYKEQKEIAVKQKTQNPTFCKKGDTL